MISLKFFFRFNKGTYSSFVFLLIISSFLLSSCSKVGLEITDKNFDEEIEMRQNLIFKFSEDLVPDSLLNSSDTTEIIRFTPKVPGRFRWAANNELIFSPDRMFLPSTEYKAEFTDELTKHAGKASSKGLEPVIFHTPLLNLTGTNVFWTKNDTDQIEANVHLLFNYKVNPAEVAELLKVKIDGKEKKFTVNTTEVTETIPISVIEPGGSNYDDKKLEISLSKGLRCTESKYVSKEIISLDSEIPAKGEFQITEVIAEYDDDTGVIHVHTNQTTESEKIKQFITINPSLPFEIEYLESGFLIKADFKVNTNYDLKISENLQGIFGGKLAEDFTQNIIFGDLDPGISFLHRKAIYLTEKGNKNIGIRIVNVPKVNVTIYKIYKNNLLEFLRNTGALYNYSYDDYYYNDYYYGSSNYENWGDVVMEREYETKNLKKYASNGSKLLNLNFDDINDLKGIYVIKVQSPDDYWLKAEQTVSISDVGLIVRETEDNIYVFANSIMTAEPIKDVNIELISTNNQGVYNLKTNNEGVAEFKGIKKKAPGFRIGMITAKAGSDFNYLHFQQTGVEKSAYDVGGKQDNPNGYQAFLYGDRDLYRPGETVYLNTVLRDGAWKPLSNIPVKIKVLLPNGREFTTLKGNLNKQGSFDTKFDLPRGSVTGTYGIEVYTSNDMLLNSRYINVEEFMPDRIKVNTSLDKNTVETGKSLTLSGRAVNLFGPPAADRNYETEFTVKRKYFTPKNYTDYNFTVSGDIETSFPSSLNEGKTDENGEFSEVYEVSKAYKDIGVLEGKVYTTVFDETGRPVNAINTFDVITQDVFFGIKYFDGYYVSTGKAQSIPLVAVDKKGNTISGATTRVQVIKHEWHTVVEKNRSGRFGYVSRKKELVKYDKKLQIDGKRTFSYVPNASGEYEIRVSKPGTDTYVSMNFYAYGYGATDFTSFEVNREGRIDIQLDKENYEIGDKATVLFKTPFQGRMLVTVERNDVFEYFYVNTDKKAASIEIPVKDEYLPNAYITATLIKPLSDGAVPLTVAHGFAPIITEKKSTKLPLEITAKQSSRSKTKQTICIKSKPESDIEVTLAVVDEGILQITNYESPDPYAFFYQKRALQVNSYDLYPRLFPDLKPRREQIGGDGGEYDLEKRVNPMADKRVNLVAFWSGVLKTNSRGETCYTIEIPQFSGSLRVMAVAYKDDAFGYAEQNIQVADPIVLSTALPRFLSPGDEADVSVTVTNTTKKSTDAQAKLTIGGNLEIVGSSSESVQLKANSEGRVEFKVRAKKAVGIGNVKVTVKAAGETFTEEQEISVRPSTSLLKKSGSGVVEAGKTAAVNLGHDFIPSSVEGKLIVSKSPLIQFADNLANLVGYPHGCAEQTISKAFPQLYFEEIAKLVGDKRLESFNARSNVREAINKIQTLQVYNGALTSWPSGGYEDWWTTAYAAHFLYEAQRAGYEVNETILKRMSDYLRNKVKEKSVITYYYRDAAGVLQKRETAAKEIGYSLYVLALTGKQDISVMNYYKGNPKLLPVDSKYLLAAAYLMLGDDQSYRKILPDGFTGEQSVNSTGGSYYSYLRDQAISLNALIDSDPKNAQIGSMAKRLSQQVKKKRYLSTQELAFSMLALGKLAKEAEKTDITAEITAGGKSVGKFTDQPLVIDENVAGKKVTIKTSGSGKLYYFWQTEGLSSTGEYVEEDNLLKVRKTFYDRFGKQISGNSFSQNDLIVVKISVNSTEDSRVDNVVITDMLPAGFEIENPRISDVPGTEWIKGQSYPDHFDIRDDRINLYANVTRTTKNFYYVVRAVSTGKFRMGPVSADAMYDGEYHSYHGARDVEVKR